MRAIVPTRPAQARAYAWSQVRVEPNPPRVGSPTHITFPLANGDPEPVVVERIVTRVAQFGMGVPWETLAAIGPYALPADPKLVVEASVEWVPKSAGHRCVRAEIVVAGAPQPLMVGCNLDVIRADALDSDWRVRFHLGNPDPEIAPITLHMEDVNAPSMLLASLLVAGRPVGLGEPVWLRPGEVVPAELVLTAEPGPAIATLQRIEATINGRLVDGIQVSLLRPAQVVTQRREYFDLAPRADFVLSAVS